MTVYIVAEDEATRAIAERLVRYCVGENKVVFDHRPKREGKIKQYLQSFNEIAKGNPVVILFDLDQNNCPKDLLNTYYEGIVKEPGLLFRTPVTEAESWLLADREGMAKFLKVPIEQLPDMYRPSPVRRPNDREIRTDNKPSMDLMALAAKSESDIIRDQLGAEDGVSKGKQYNTALTPFIQKKWNIKRAMKNSYSLERSVRRICEYFKSIEENAH